MSGHSKWSTIKHKKGRADARRGKLFSKLNKEITIAARAGGGDVDGNPRLRTAVMKAKEANMPSDNMERAIKKGTGEIEGVIYEEMTYEGYAPSGVAVIVETVTDNKNRTTAEVRHLFAKYGGNLGENGCVSWLFDSKGIIVIDKEECDEDTVIEIALEAGAEDIDTAGSAYEITTEFAEFDAVKKAFDEKNIKTIEAEITKTPQTTVELSGKPAQTVLKLVDLLDDHDDVQKVHANFEISEEELARIFEE
jgi:YebC/PmpR family DNA-binding regulatory protein